MYPRRLQIRIPEAGMEWELTPAFDDQEFSMMMNMMAFWTGTGSVQGSTGGVSATGRYCSMLQGYGKE